MPQQKIYLVGAGITGWEGFNSKALEVIGKAEVLIGPQRHLDIFPDFKGEKQPLGDVDAQEFGESLPNLTVGNHDSDLAIGARGGRPDGVASTAQPGAGIETALQRWIGPAAADQSIEPETSCRAPED